VEENEMQSRRPSDPEWTEYRTKNGLDPLGMQNSSVSLYQMLLPGVGNVTQRVRYYGLYAWLSWIYAQRIGDTNSESWKRFIRRAEALYALIAQRRGGETGIAGIRWAGRTLAGTSARTIDFKDDAEPGSATSYFAVEWGVFGLAYRSQLFQIGILTTSDEHEIDIPSQEIGEPLARAFDKELGNLAAPFYSTIRRSRVTPSELDNFARLSASGVLKKSAERGLYERILFARGERSTASDRTRRLSLLLILKTAAQLKRMPTADDVRWILYAGKDELGRTFSPGTPDLEAQRQRWLVYQANDLCHLALETILKYALDVLGEFSRGIMPSALIARCVTQLMAVAQPKCQSWNEFVSALIPTNNANDARNRDSEWSLAQDVLQVRREEDVCTPEAAWKAIKLLGLLHRRERASAALIAQDLKGFDPEFFHSLLTECRFLECHGEAPFAETLTRLIDERVVRRHLWIALRKLRYQGDYTFLIETDDGLIRLRQKYGPVFTNPRLSPAVRFLSDIHLIDDNGLTPRGVEVLETP
jgi:hypothetical protein